MEGRKGEQEGKGKIGGKERQEFKAGRESRREGKAGMEGRREGRKAKQEGEGQAGRKGENGWQEGRQEGKGGKGGREETESICDDFVAKQVQTCYRCRVHFHQGRRLKMCITKDGERTVRYHCGGWSEEVNSCILISYMVYLLPKHSLIIIYIRRYYIHIYRLTIYMAQSPCSFLPLADSPCSLFYSPLLIWKPSLL